VRKGRKNTYRPIPAPPFFWVTTNPNKYYPH
jgi:hypothetical protein